MIDLKGGRAVRGRSGDRAAYRPVVSRLRGTPPEDLSDPAALLLAYRETLRPERVYVADLDRIDGSGDNGAAIERLLDAAPEVTLLLDRGAAGAHPPFAGPERRTAQVVATETLRSPADLQGHARPRGDALFSLDLGRDGVLARSAEVTALGAEVLLRRAARSGFREAIVLVLDRVGTGAGLPRHRLRKLRAAVPALDLLAAGGIATWDDLEFLSAAGFSGALIGTALHEGWIRPGDLRSAFG